MRRRYSVPSAYLRHIESQLVLSIAEAARDKAWREDDDDRLRRFAPIADDRVDADREGHVFITIEMDDVVDVAVDPAAGLETTNVVPLPVREPLQVAS